MFEKKYTANVLASCSGEGLQKAEVGAKELIQEEISLEGIKSLVFSFFGSVEVGKRRKQSWKGDIPFFLVKGECGHIFLDYPHGHSNRLDCPVCK